MSLKKFKKSYTNDTYWNNNGLYQKRSQELLVKLENDLVSCTKNTAPWRKEYIPLQKEFWATHSESALLSAMNDIYYAFYNHKFTVVEAFQNNRVHGFDSLNELLDGRPFDTPKIIVNFLKSERRITKKRLEKVMDAMFAYL